MQSAISAIVDFGFNNLEVNRIEAFMAVDNIPSQMPAPPNAMLTPVDKQKIVDWVNAGHRQSD